jgi:hypothetical protein
MASISSRGSKGHHTYNLTLTQASQSIANNNSTVNYSFELIDDVNWFWESWGNSITYSISANGSVIASGSIPNHTTKNQTVASGSFTVPHNADGTKKISYSFSVDDNAGQYYTSGDASASGEMTLTTIPRQANITSAPNFNDEENPTIYYNNSAGNSVSSLQACISLTGSLSDIEYRDISKTGTSYTFNLTEAERNVLRKACTTSNSRSVIFFIKTVINGITYHSTLSKTLSIVNANPTVGTLTYKDNNSITTEITGDNQRIIRNNSNLVFTIGTATALKGATISKYEIAFNEATKSRTSAGTLDFGQINLSYNSDATLKVTDSRGNTSSKTITIIIDDWVLPTALISLKRKNNFYSESYLKVDASYSYINSKNAITIQYQYKKVSDSKYSELANLSDNVQATLDLDNNFKWDVKVVVKDKIGSTTYNLFLDRGMPIIYFDRYLSSVGINCFPTKEKELKVDGEVNSEGILKPTTLYENSSGSNGTITLSETSANFKSLKIYYRSNDATTWASCSEVETPNGKTIDLTYFANSDNVTEIYIRTKNVQVSDNTITTITNRHHIANIGNGSCATGSSNHIYITKVVGYR